MICEDCKNVVNKFYSLDVYRTEIDKLNSQIEEEKGKIEKAIQQIKVDMAEATARTADTKARLNQEYLDSLKEELK